MTDKTGVEPLPENCDDVFSKSPRYKRWPCAMGSSGKAGGIWRKVYLVKKPETYMNPFVIETSKTKFCIQPDVVGDAADYTIEYIMSDGSENVSGTVCAAAKSFVIEMPNPVLSWPLILRKISGQIRSDRTDYKAAGAAYAFGGAQQRFQTQR